MLLRSSCVAGRWYYRARGVGHRVVTILGGGWSVVLFALGGVGHHVVTILGDVRGRGVGHDVVTILGDGWSMMLFAVGGWGIMLLRYAYTLVSMSFNAH